MKKRNRRVYLDVLRVLAACAVVLLHTVSGAADTMGFSAYPTEQCVFRLVMDLTKWSVPVFLMISGYLFLGYDCGNLSFAVMLKKYCLRIASALLLFGSLYACVEKLAGGADFSARLLGESVLAVFRGESWAHMWYLYLILILYLLTPLLQKVTDVLPRPFVYLLLGVIFLRSSLVPFAEAAFGVRYVKALPDEWIYVFYYVYGYLFSYEDVMEEKNCDRRLWVAKLQAVVAPAVVLVQTVGVTACRLRGVEQQMAYNDPVTVLFALSLFAWARALSRLRGEKRSLHAGQPGKLSETSEREPSAEGEKKKHGFLQAASALTFGIYLMHPVFLNVCYKFLKVTPLSFDIRLSLPLFFLGALFSAAAATLILRKIPFMRKYIL